MDNLVIVESPTKARTLSKFLGNKYTIEASMGHVRDLPKSDIGVDVEQNFEPRYIVPKSKIKQVNQLKKIALGARTLWLATDPDREGEAIAWHLEQILNSEKRAHKPEFKRVVFHEITQTAVKEAFDHPRDLDLKLIDAQQARRVLDRLVGYKLSPLLWKKVKSGLSAGRVQSVAVRLVVEREREIDKFKPVEYWSIEAKLQPKGKKVFFFAAVIEKDHKKLSINNAAEAKKILSDLKSAPYNVDKITKKEVRRYPAPPFTTSTLQQAGSNKLGMSAKKTMMVAQYLYEHGLITYMRTDSVNLSTQAISQARSYIEQHIGKAYLPTAPKYYKTKSKVAQEAHEAIRPTNLNVLSDQLKTMGGMTRDHIRLYDLIWKRSLACQMNEAVMDQTTVDVGASAYTLRASGSVIKFDGWLKIYGVDKALPEEEEDETKAQALPVLKEGEDLDLLDLKDEQHFTEPPPRYNEASLIKKLEELGIGRPSTYAPIISTIQERFYVERKERRFYPTPVGIAVTDFLVKNFPDIVDYTFTSQMEDELDEIARGERKWQPTIAEFYKPFEKKVEATEGIAKVKIEAEQVDKKCPDCGKPLQVKYGRFGKFLACTGFPDCKYTESFEQLINAKCPQDGGDIVVRKTRRGKPFYGCKNWPNCKYASWTKPK
ncbi:type I DNA topoisomerase [Candidatus Daviesbacteria bacterium]|nr:type I DNA topoisomerase [Candidatus Daviesbacteria bacterium]